MSTDIDILRVRGRLGREGWQLPREHGPNGWSMVNRHGDGSVIISAPGPFWIEGDPAEYLHASLAYADRDPTYLELAELHRAVWGPHGWSVLVFADRGAHINIHAHALHLWGRLDGKRFTPDFGWAGTI